jgi:hypothetical protein
MITNFAIVVCFASIWCFTGYSFMRFSLFKQGRIGMNVKINHCLIFVVFALP